MKNTKNGYYLLIKDSNLQNRKISPQDKFCKC